MNIVFRTDASSFIGTGHVMRCLALAQEAKTRGMTPYFLGRIAPALVARLHDEDMKTDVWDNEIPLDQDLSRLLAAAQDSVAVVIDHYGLGPDYQKEIRQGGHRLLVIDDYNHQPAYDADILLNQNIPASKYAYNINSSAKLLLGPQFALLRREFLAHPRPDAASRQLVRNLLITLGGADPDNRTLLVLEALERLNIIDLHVKVVCGPAFTGLKNVQSLLNSSSLDAETLSAVTDMAPLYSWADAVVAAAGSSVYELAYFRLPAAILCLADNQREIGQSLARSGKAFYLGEPCDTARMQALLLEFFSNTSRLKVWSESIGQLVDGLGVSRVMDDLEGIRS